MDEPDDLDPRVEALEGDDFRTQNARVLSAFREDVNERFAEVDRNFAEMRARLAGAAAGQQQIVRMLDVLISRDDPSP